jgi:hypothetical protein
MTGDNEALVVAHDLGAEPLGAGRTYSCEKNAFLTSV